MNKLTILTGLLLAGLGSQQALANNVHIENISPDKKPIDLELQVVAQNRTNQLVYGEKFHLIIDTETDHQLNMDNYKSIGLLPISINGKKITSFRHSDAISFSKMTTKDHPNEKMQFGFGCSTPKIHSFNPLVSH